MKSSKMPLVIPYCEHDGIRFLTQPADPLQVGIMRYPKGHIIESHKHTNGTCEVLFIRRGIVRADFYDDANNHYWSRLFGPGDVILLRGGGHGFLVMKDAELVEVKTGPYVDDKVRFKGIA